MKINISETTRHYLREYPEFEVEEREAIEIKVSKYRFRNECSIHICCIMGRFQMCWHNVMILAQRKVGWTLRYFFRDTSILFGPTDLGTFTQTWVRQHGYRICFEFIPWFVFLINRVKAWWTHTGLLTQTRTECTALTMVWYIAYLFWVSLRRLVELNIVV